MVVLRVTAIPTVCLAGSEVKENVQTSGLNFDFFGISAVSEGNLKENISAVRKGAEQLKKVG